MIILGIDPGTAETGAGIITADNQSCRLVHHTCITTKTQFSPEQRLQQIFHTVTDLINTHHPDILTMESLFFATNAKSVMAVGQAMGVIMLAAATAQIPVVKYSPPQVKRAITGDGRAKKPQLQQVVKKLLKLKTVPRPQHAADALAVALCHSAIIFPGKGVTKLHDRH